MNEGSAVAVPARSDSWSPPGERVESGPAPSSGTAPLLAQPETAAVDCPPSSPVAVQLGQAYVAIAALLGVVSRSLSLRKGETRHLGSCRIGQWVDQYSGGDGAPCSASCVDAGGAYLLGLSVLGRDVTGAPAGTEG